MVPPLPVLPSKRISPLFVMRLAIDDDIIIAPPLRVAVLLRNLALFARRVKMLVPVEVSAVVMPIAPPEEPFALFPEKIIVSTSTTRQP